MNRKQLLEDMVDRYGEWLEMAGARAPYLIQNILADALLKEREKIKYLENRLKSYDIKIEGATK